VENQRGQLWFGKRYRNIGEINGIGTAGNLGKTDDLIGDDTRKTKKEHDIKKDRIFKSDPFL